MLFQILNMKKYIFLILLLVLSTNIIKAQCLYFTSSLGWGYGLSTKGIFIEGAGVTGTRIDYQSRLSFSNFLANPQTGYFLEYRVNKNHAIGIGRMTGKIEHRTFVQLSNNKPGYYYLFGALYSKLGITYTYIYKNRWLFQVGLFKANNQISAIENGANLTSSSKDNQGITRDSTNLNYGIPLRKWGTTSSVCIGYTFLNKKKNRARFNLNVLLDLGWNQLDGVKTYIMYDYNKVVTSFSKSNGSQLKIYISKPILLYDFKKDKYKIFR